MTRPEAFSAQQWNRWVKRGRKLVQSETDIQFKLGDLTLEIVPQQEHGNGDRGVESVLESFADEIGLSSSTIASYRRVSIAWPKGHRNGDTSFTVHDILSAHPKRFQLINHPRKDPVSGDRVWTVNEALRAAGRVPMRPVTTLERVERVGRIVKDDDDATMAVIDLLRRPTVARNVMKHAPSARILRTAEPRQHEGDTAPNRRANEQRGASGGYSSSSYEVLSLIEACTGFYTRMQNLIPTLHVRSYDDDAKNAVLDSLKRVRACADWAESVISTGDTSMDEALHNLLGGE